MAMQKMNKENPNYTLAFMKIPHHPTLPLSFQFIVMLIEFTVFRF